MDAHALLDKITVDNVDNLDNYVHDNSQDGRPAIGWPDPLLMALCRAHPERIPAALKVEIATSRTTVLAPAAA